MKISKCKFQNLDALLIEKKGIEIVVVTQFGPRIASLRRPGRRNLLFWDIEGKYNRSKWCLRGGHRVWTTRPGGADESEETYMEDNAVCTIEQSPSRVQIIGCKDPQFMIQRGILIEDTEHDNCLDIVNLATNQSDMLWSGGIWGITCTNPENKTYAIPLGSGDQKDPWDVLSICIPKRWAGHTSLVNDPQLSWGENILKIVPGGTESKRAVQAHQGWIGCYAPEDGVSFFKLMKYDPALAGLYPNMCNAAYYVGPDNFMVEMELMGPQQRVMRKQTISLRERWVLTDAIPWNKDFQLIQGALSRYFMGKEQA